MHPDTRKSAHLALDGVPFEALATEFGTPAYVYSASTLLGRYREMDAAFALIPHRILYSVKANSSRALLSMLASEGAGADVVSGGEMVRAIRAGFPPERIVFAGAGKTDEELQAAIDAGIKLINIESVGELARLERLAKNRVIPIALRVTPEIVGGTHEYTETGTGGTKFGLPVDQALDLIRGLATRGRRSTGGGVSLVGLHVHFGSQITHLPPFLEAADRLRHLTGLARECGADIRYLNMGGGLGIRYRDENPPTPADLAKAVIPHFKDLEVELLLEPGRWIVAPVGWLLSRVIDVKTTGNDTFVILDAGMNDLIRPALYDAHHEIIPVTPRPGPVQPVEIVGPICESGDFLAHARQMSPLEPGDLVAIRDTGAYGFSMASNYNSRPRAVEVLVEDGTARVIRRRETIEDLLAGELA